MENGLLGFAGQGPAIDLDPNTQLFTASGIWTKPADCQWVRVIIAGGGGGGQGGRRSQNITAGTTERPSGGAGGAGGGYSFMDIPAGLLPSTVSITIGAGGAGGAGATTANTTGSNGSSGGTTSFGDILTAGGGAGGSTSIAAGGSGLIYGGRGTESFFGEIRGTWSRSVTAGGGGGGSASSDQLLIYPPSATWQALSPFGEPQKYGVIGAAGVGGRGNITGTRPSSASNGTLGNGGGGGGAGKNAYNGETGGAGGDGYCLVVSYGTAVRPINVQEFTSSGTWTKPTDPRLGTARVFIVGGGGGGGSGRRWNRSNGARLTGSELAVGYVSGCYASVPDSAALSITGDIDIKAKISMFSWCESNRIVNNGNTTANTIVSKWASGGQQSFQFNINQAGTLSFTWSTTGSDSLTVFPTNTIELSRYATKWVRVTMDVNNGAGSRVHKFYTSDDGSTWTQLGSTVTTSGTTSIFDSTAAINVSGVSSGTSQWVEGKIYRVIVENGYDGAGTAQLDANFETATSGAATFTESSTNAATVTINSASTNVFGGGGGGGGAVSYAEFPLAFLPSQVDVTVGLGGAGGPGITTDYTNGAHGEFGGQTLFGTYLSAIGGERGYGGTSSAGSISMGTTYDEGVVLTGYTRGSLCGGSSGGTGSNSTGSSSGATTGFAASYMTCGGGGGGGINTSGTTAAGGTSVKPNGYGTVISTTTATSNGVNLFSYGAGIYGSTGGGGGSSNGTLNGGIGGRGSGGGGGAASGDGTTSGAGGNGGDGYVLVVCV